VMLFGLLHTQEKFIDYGTESLVSGMCRDCDEALTSGSGRTFGHR
jgi:hypothetical protein